MPLSFKILCQIKNKKPFGTVCVQDKCKLEVQPNFIHFAAPPEIPTTDLLPNLHKELVINQKGAIYRMRGYYKFSQEILKRLGAKGFLLAIDQDSQAVAYGKSHFEKDKRIKIEQHNFSEILKVVEQHKVKGRVNGILFDLGVSSPQLDDPQRGFSFMHDGPLDMRMNNESGISAAEWLQKVSERELESVLKEYGQERYAKKIAAAIIKQREKASITTTKELADIVVKSVGASREQKHPATRTFQAIRIYINSELDILAKVLDDCLDVLADSGRLLVITFHSLEDQIVKTFLRKHSQPLLPRKLPVINKTKPRLTKVCKPIKSSEEEVAKNPRARSAKLYVLEHVTC